MVPEAITAVRLEQAERAVGSAVLYCVPDCIECTPPRGRHVLGYAAVTVLKIWLLIEPIRARLASLSQKVIHVGKKLDLSDGMVERTWLVFTLNKTDGFEEGMQGALPANCRTSRTI